MKALAKAGFTQSYTYFTWRTDKAGAHEYFTELTQTEMREYFRGNLCSQHARHPARSICKPAAARCFRFAPCWPRRFRASTASTAALSCAKTPPLPGREEYLDSEKYQFKERDWNAPGNIKDLITKLNRIRRENRALHFYDNLRFHPADNDALLFYGKMTPARDSIILVVVNLDPLYTQSATWRRRSKSSARSEATATKFTTS